jgi:hypothetical protein
MSVGIMILFWAVTLLGYLYAARKNEFRKISIKSCLKEQHKHLVEENNYKSSPVVIELVDQSPMDSRQVEGESGVYVDEDILEVDHNLYGYDREERNEEDKHEPIMITT